MANYTFTASSCYALNTHDVKFTATNVIIKLTSTGQVVYDQKYDTGLSIMCDKDDFCVGTLADNGTFKNTVDFNDPNAVLRLVEKKEANTFIGSTNETNDEIYKYVLNQCPVRLLESNKIVTIECPCESAIGPCKNQCYTKS